MTPRVWGLVMEKNQHDQRGRKAGPWEEYFRDSQLSGSGAYQAGKKAGEWQYYDARGTLTRTKTFGRGGDQE